MWYDTCKQNLFAAVVTLTLQNILSITIKVLSFLNSKCQNAKTYWINMRALTRLFKILESESLEINILTFQLRKMFDWFVSKYFKRFNGLLIDVFSLLMTLQMVFFHEKYILFHNIHIHSLWNISFPFTSLHKSSLNNVLFCFSIPFKLHIIQRTMNLNVSRKDFLFWKKVNIHIPKDIYIWYSVL